MFDLRPPHLYRERLAIVRVDRDKKKSRVSPGTPPTGRRALRVVAEVENPLDVFVGTEDVRLVAIVNVLLFATGRRTYGKIWIWFTRRPEESTDRVTCHTATTCMQPTSTTNRVAIYRSQPVTRICLSSAVLFDLPWTTPILAYPVPTATATSLGRQWLLPRPSHGAAYHDSTNEPHTYLRDHIQSPLRWQSC